MKNNETPIEIPASVFWAISSLLEDVEFLPRSGNYNTGEKVLPYQHKHLNTLAGEARAILAKITHSN
tara:strand:- start:2388 stop:2588 length:201 start_codon:yes stop_codon:yes gene_type:complete